MNKKIEEFLVAWKNKYGEDNGNFTDERITEIAVNCMSISSAWLEKVKNIKNISLRLDLFNKDNIVCESLHGVTKDNLPETIMDILVNKNNNYSKICLSYFSYSENCKIDKTIGELEIS